MSAQPQPQQPYVPQQQRQQLSDQEVDQFLEQLIGGDLPGEGFLFPDSEESKDPRETPTPQDVRNELLRASKIMAIALQLPYGEEKKADLGHAMLSAAQAYLLLDPSLDEEGTPVTGEGSKAFAQAEAAHKFPPRVQPNAAEQRLNDRTKGMQKDLKAARGQTPRPRPRPTG